jgi:ubiquinone/menaquinone biosynthesis C-methylase UbiE
MPPHGHHHHGRHGNPDDLDAYLAKLEDPARDEWQKPDEVLRALALEKGAVVCDIGGGPGYFALRMARVVGERGQVFAVDVEPRMLAELRRRIEAGGPRNLTPVLGLDDDPLLPPASCDLILVVNTFHHFPDGVAYLKRLARSLKPGARIANIDFQKRELPMGPPTEHKISREEFLEQAARAGLTLVDEPAFLPHQYFLILKA